MAANNEKPFELPSLLESAYNACQQFEQDGFNELEVLPVDLQKCCKSLFKVMKLNTESGDFDHFGDIRSMFSKVKSLMGDDIYICEDAAFYGHINCMKFARAIGVPWNTSTILGDSACDKATTSGSLECLIYAHENGSFSNQETLGLAAWEGQLECLKYLHEIGTPWHPRTCCFAAYRGHLDCLKYVHTNRCPWDEFARTIAINGGHADCIDYINRNYLRRPYW